MWALPVRTCAPYAVRTCTPYAVRCRRQGNGVLPTSQHSALASPGPHAAPGASRSQCCKLHQPKGKGNCGSDPQSPPRKGGEQAGCRGGEGRGLPGPLAGLWGLGCAGSSWCWLYNTECSRKRGQAFLNVNFVLQPSGLAAIRRLRSIPREGAAQSDARTPPADADSGGHGVRRPRDLRGGAGLAGGVPGDSPRC